VDASAAVGIVGVLAVIVGVVVAVVASRREQARNRTQVAAVAEAVAGATPAFAPSSDDAQPSTRRRTPSTGPNDVATPSWRSDDTEDRLLEGVSARVATRFKVLQIHYQRALEQSTTYFYASLIAGLVGFALLLAGAVLALADMTPTGTVTGLGGAIATAAAALIFGQANCAKADAQSNLAAIALSIEEDQKYLLALLCVARIEDATVRDATNAALARELIGADATSSTTG
jgi:hypothetical protein